jgi:hypothetical protein
MRLFVLLASFIATALGQTTTSTVLDSPSPQPFVQSQPVTLHAIVGPSGVTGTVTFWDGNLILGTANLIAVNQGNGVDMEATFVTTALLWGTDSIRARYNGSSSYSPSWSGTLTFGISAGPSSGLKTAQSYAAGENPSAIGVGDFNRDGIQDLVIGHSTGNSVTVLLGNANGSFQPPVPYTVGVGPSYVLVSEFNGDGIPDVAVANFASNTVSILPGNGSGSFQAARTVTVAAAPVALAAGDFNQDGITDLAVMRETDVGILLGQKDGSFAAEVRYTTGSRLTGIVVADFNRDGKADLVVASHNTAAVNFLAGNGDGTFQAAVSSTTVSSPLGIVAGDLDSDGLPDIATANDNGTVSVLKGNGNGTFQFPVVLSTGVQNASLTMTDLDGSGTVDLVVASPSDGMTALIRLGNGTFAPPLIFPAGATPTFAAWGDFNKDGLTDIVLANNLGTDVSVLLGGGTLTTTTALGVNPSAAIQNQTVTLTATVSPSAAPGSATFFDGANPIGTISLSSGSAALSTSLLPVGSHTLKAVYSGGSAGFGASYQSSTSPDTNLTVNPVTGVSLTVSPSPAVFGQAVTLTATVTPATAGLVTYYDGVQPIGTAAPNAGTASMAAAGLSPGMHSLRAVYIGTAGNAASVASPVRSLSVTAVSANDLVAGAVLPAGAAAIADFNGDGKMDLIVCGSSIQVFTGSGSGTFTLAATYPLNVAAGRVVAGDFDGDGKMDAAVLANGNRAAVLHGNGDGTFNIDPNLLNGSFAVGANPVWISAGDFNNDGWTDFAVVNSGDNTVTIALRKSGAFVTTTYALGANLRSAAVADLNGDGRADLIVASASVNGVRVMLGNGDGSFQAPITITGGTSPQGVAAGDFNGDGKVDLAVADAAGMVWVKLGNGDGTFQNSLVSFVPWTPLAIALTDFNADGKLDIVLGNVNGPAVAIFLGNGDGTFQSPHTENSPGSVSTIAATELNGDGRVDILIAADNGIRVLLGNMQTLTTTPTSTLLAASPSPAGLGQPVTLTATVSPASAIGQVLFYENGNYMGASAVTNGAATLRTVSLPIGPAVIQAVYSGGVQDTPSALTTFLPSSAMGALVVNAAPGGNFSAPATYPASGPPVDLGDFKIRPSAAVADLNGDGIADIITSSVTGYGYVVLRGKGDGTFLAPVVSATGTLGPIALADWNGDGFLDAIGADAESTSLIALNAGDGSFPLENVSLFNPGGDATSFAVGDFDNDGRPDMALTTSQGTVNIYIPAIGGGPALTAGTTPAFVAIGDFNRDGNSDLAVASSGSNNVTILLGNGNGTFQPGVNYAVGTAPVHLLVADLNGDGKQDLAVANSGSNNLSVLLGNGNGTFQPAVNFAAGTSPRWVVVTDFNGDGKLDLASANYSSNDVSRLIGNGSGSFQPASAIPVGVGPVWLGAADFNGDGRADLAVLDATSDDVKVLLAAAPAVPVLTWTQPADIAVGSALGPMQLNATANVPGTWVYTPPAGTVLPVGDGQALRADFTPTDTLSYSTASKTVLINVKPAPPGSPVNIVATAVLTRDAGTSQIVARVTLTNAGGTSASSVTLQVARLGLVTGSPLPQVIGALSAGAAATVEVRFPGTAGTPGAASLLTISGAYSGGSFNAQIRKTIP